MNAIGVERRAKGAAGIAGRRRNEHPLEARLAKMRALAHPFSATPPPRHRSPQAGFARAARGEIDHVSSSTFCTLAAMSAKRAPSSVGRIDGS